MQTRPLSPSDLTVPGRVLIKRKQLLQKVPLSERTIFAMEQRGEFPKRFTISSRLVAWDLAEVDAWIEAQQQARQQAVAPTKQPGKR
ncbi:putative DNA-binding transcriptional regulator AlpA [Duganella sp. 3397]|uniref:helix-turn-helix transcriptional regulator n=1 Tax=Duganella sp. 3397 TaxID=2817732 RepID=UPI00285FBC46|nr:AlpA family phage regulatory protein [Duganella sp. 3397]MDR7048611.1 putative DNA-binding transcriptional regulator AlpA [Duganella sp. 3397]